MNDYIIMVVLIGFLALLLLAGTTKAVSENHFFDLTNSYAMRGFWCLIVVLVHIPATYQNRIQDMLGSFGYIGVTFFFMTSGYGLTLSSEKNGKNIKSFWQNRLPSLLIPGWVVNFLFAIITKLFLGDQIKLLDILNIDIWVKWLLGCYFIFWFSHILIKTQHWKIVAIILTSLLSITYYILDKLALITRTTWATECFGFIWGIVLSAIIFNFLQFFKDKWLAKWCLSLIIALLLGIAYLKFKPIIFWGDYLLKILLGLAITIFILISNVRFEIGNKLNLLLGKISFEVYLIHGYIFYLLSKLYPGLSSGEFISLSLLCTVLTAYVIHQLDSIIINKIYLLFNREDVNKKI